MNEESTRLKTYKGCGGEDELNIWAGLAFSTLNIDKCLDVRARQLGQQEKNSNGRENRVLYQEEMKI